LNAFFILDDDDVLEISFATCGHLVDPLGSARVEEKSKFIFSAGTTVSYVVTFQIAVMAL
jgi:hypothetical protein